MTDLQTYRRINLEVCQGKPHYICKNDSGVGFSCLPTRESRRLRPLRIGIYAGTGSSHSWLWFVDMFEKTGNWDLAFLDEKNLKQGSAEDLDVLVISGGDTFAVAESIGREGAGTIRSFVEGGGIYIGSCAGAYLPMHSSKNHLNHFNFVDIKITNLSKTLPVQIKSSRKFCTSYGCDFVFHPVREEVRIKLAANGSSKHFTAPMYGGPAMKAATSDVIIATYDGFTEKTSFLVDEPIATTALIGHAAIVRVPCGKGIFYLFGPHLEHPDYPTANMWVANTIHWESGWKDGRSGAAIRRRPSAGNDKAFSGKRASELIRDLKRELSNSRIAALSLEFAPVSWLIGTKVYEPEKVRVFLESMWKRIKPMEACHTLHAGGSGGADRMVSVARQVTALIRKIKTGIDHDQDTQGLAITLFERLHVLSTHFLDFYFKTMLYHHKGHGPA